MNYKNKLIQNKKRKQTKKGKLAVILAKIHNQ